MKRKVKQIHIDKIKNQVKQFENEPDYIAKLLKHYNATCLEDLTVKQGLSARKLIRRWHQEYRTNFNGVKRYKRKKQKSEKSKKVYKKYLQSQHWTDTKKRLKKPYCFVCLSIKDLHLHHKNYRCLYKETVDDVVTLCGSCHAKVHKLAKKKTLNIDSAGQKKNY